MKAILIVLGGSVLAISTFVGGLISATAMFTTRNPPPLAAANVSELWTTTPVKVDTASQSLDRVAPRPVASPSRAEANSRSDALATVRDSVPNPRVAASSRPEMGGSAVGDARPEMAAEHLDWCATRYRSYRPRDNSYTPFSGGRRQCESPYSILPSGSGAEPDVEEISEAPNGDDSFEDASIAVPARQQEVADLGRSSVRGDEHAQSCFARYRSYRIEDNSYQPVSGGPRRQCQ
jgi:hypothetical protein